MPIGFIVFIAAIILLVITIKWQSFNIRDVEILTKKKPFKSNRRAKETKYFRRLRRKRNEKVFG